MSVAPDTALRFRRNIGAEGIWIILAGLPAIALGIATGVNPQIAVVLTAGFALAVLCVSRPAALLPILAGGLFLETVAVGGARFERLIAPITLVVVAIELIRRTATIRVAAPLFWATAYALWALASGLWTVSMTGTLLWLASLAIAITYMLAFAALLNTERDLRRILHVLAITALIVGASSVLAFAGRNPFLSSSTLQQGRAQGGVGDPEAFAAFQLFLLPLFLVLIVETRKLWLRALFVLGALVAVASVITSVSRTGFVAGAVLLLVLLVLPARVLFQTPRQKAALLLLVTIGLVGILSRPFPRHQAWKRISATWSPQKSGASRGSGREDLWIVARQKFREHPFTGIGFGVFPYVSQDYLVQTPGVDLTFYVPRPPGKYLFAHSTYFGSAAELGLPGLALYLAMLFSMGRTLRRFAIRARDLGAHTLSRVANALLIGLATWVVSSAFLETETSRPFWILLGITLALPKVLDSVVARGELGTWR